MRRFALILCGSLVSYSAVAQTLTLTNLTHPGVNIEVGNAVQVAIAGATPAATVTVDLDGAGPAAVGTTDGRRVTADPSIAGKNI